MALKCVVGSSLWNKNSLKRMLPGTKHVAVQCRFRVEYARRKDNNEFVLSNFFFHHRHPLSLEYER